MARLYLEMAQDQGLTTGVSPEDGSASCWYRLSGSTETTFPDVTDLRATIRDIVGDVTNIYPATSNYGTPYAGKIRRVLPKCHPWLEMPAAGVPTIQGESHQKAEIPLRPTVYGPAQSSYITPLFTHYSSYLFQVQFRKRPYFLKSDEAIASASTTYYPPGTSTPKTIYYAKEWERFCWRTLAPTGEIVSTEHEDMMIYAPGVDQTDEAAFPGSPYVSLQNQAMELTWYQVPLRYMFDFTRDGVTYKSYLSRFVNTVNQTEILGCAPGTLLFEGATPEPYMPAIVPTPRVGGFDLNETLLCNLKLKFLYTTRESSVTVNPADTWLAGDKNNIAAGHNLAPNFRTPGDFYPIHTYDGFNREDQTKWKCPFRSFPFELLFTDPMMTQPEGPI